MTGRELSRRIGIVVAAALIVGAVGAFIWSRVAVLPVFVMDVDGHANITEADMGKVASADWTFAIIALVGGFGLGLVAWRLLGSIGWPVALVCLASALIAAVACWLLGEALGPDSFDQRLSEAVAGESVPVALTLHARAALLLWPFAAVAVPLFAASLGPDGDSGEEARGPDSGQQETRSPVAGDEAPASAGSPN
ncbi:MAG: hypothetical protein ACK5LN_10580 [Propioniciclava sp.]